jgi:hypothetical protein
MDSPCKSEDADYQGYGHYSTFQLAMSAAIQMLLTKGNHPSKPHDGMRQPHWVAEYQIE